MVSDDAVKRIVRATKADFHADSATASSSAAMSPPESLRGSLARANAMKPSSLSSASSIGENDPFAISHIIFRNSVPWKGLRTGPNVLNVLTREVRAAKTYGEVTQAVQELPRRLLSTGAFKSVSVGTAPSTETGTNHGGGLDLVVDIDESSFSVNTSATQSLSGSLATAAEVSVFNVLGQAETISGRVGSATGDISIGGFAADFLHPAALGRDAASSSSSASAAVQRTAEMLTTPTFLLEMKSPTFFDARTPALLRLRRDVEYHDVTSGFRNKVLEVEAGLTDPSNTHSVSYACAWRNLSPLRMKTSNAASSSSSSAASSNVPLAKLFATGSSPEVVSNCDSSLKSSFSYSYANSAMAGANKTPSAGYKALFRAELAGAGGDVQFFRAAFNGLWAASIGRFTPDMGYKAPLHKSAYLDAMTMNDKSTSVGNEGSGTSDEDGHQMLRPHPGPAVLDFWSRVISGTTNHTDPPVVVHSVPSASSSSSSSSSSNVLPSSSSSSSSSSSALSSALDRTKNYLRPYHHQNHHHHHSLTTPSPPEYTVEDRLAGWLSPGITGQADVSLGAIFPFGNSAQRPYGTRIVDRFFVTGSKFRGFDSIGPRAELVEGGNVIGDILGGDYLAAFTGRVLFPAPFPSVRLANAGLRSQAFVSVGSLLPGAEVATGDSSSALFKRISASAGVGLYLPLVSGTALEANWALWHASHAQDVTAKFRFQMTM